MELYVFQFLRPLKVRFVDSYELVLGTLEVRVHLEAHLSLILAH